MILKYLEYDNTEATTSVHEVLNWKTVPENTLIINPLINIFCDVLRTQDSNLSELGMGYNFVCWYMLQTLDISKKYAREWILHRRQ